MARTSGPQATLSSDSAALRELAFRYPDRYPLLLDSASSGPRSIRHLLLRTDGRHLQRDALGRVSGAGVDPKGGFLDSLQHWFHESGGGSIGQSGWPGGWAIYLGYECAAEIEPSLRLPPSPDPVSAFAAYCPVQITVAVDSDQVIIQGERGSESLIDECMDDLRRVGSEPISRPVLQCELKEEPGEAFLGMVRSAQQHIGAGDIYQANLSRLWQGQLLDRESQATARLYQQLRAANPGPFACLLQIGSYAVLSSSPERLIAVRGRELSTRPIAGTRPRSRNAGADRAEIAALVAHPKERAEHIMLIDLERNDLGRVCEAGTVEVDEWLAVETYQHVHHIVSNVHGRMRRGLTAIDALRAVFPGGTITGVPKVRCMQIIADLERQGRGAYTGSVGYLGRNGDADFNILIRSLVIDGQSLRLRTGAGIVADSSPERELEETRAKARGLLAALGQVP